MLIGGQIRYFLKNFLLYGSGRTWIQHRLHPIFRTELYHILNGFLSDLMLKQDNLTLQKRIFYFIHIVNVHTVVGTCHHNDGIIMVPNRNHRQTCGHSHNCLDALCLNSCVLKVFYKFCPCGVISHTSEHFHLCPKLCYCHSLIGAFPSRDVLQIFPFESLPFQGDSLCFHGHIHVDTSDYSNFSHVFPLRFLFFDYIINFYIKFSILFYIFFRKNLRFVYNI